MEVFSFEGTSRRNVIVVVFTRAPGSVTAVCINLCSFAIRSGIRRICLDTCNLDSYVCRC